MTLNDLKWQAVRLDMKELMSNKDRIVLAQASSGTNFNTFLSRHPLGKPHRSNTFVTLRL
eukprot:263956-Prorocentrum_minimum.AAC.1